MMPYLIILAQIAVFLTLLCLHLKWKARLTKDIQQQADKTTVTE